MVFKYKYYLYNLIKHCNKINSFLNFIIILLTCNFFELILEFNNWIINLRDTDKDKGIKNKSETENKEKVLFTGVWYIYFNSSYIYNMLN